MAQVQSSGCGEFRSDQEPAISNVPRCQRASLFYNYAMAGNAHTTSCYSPYHPLDRRKTRKLVVSARSGRAYFICQVESALLTCVACRWLDGLLSP